jgi:hypothetical protein
LLIKYNNIKLPNKNKHQIINKVIKNYAKEFENNQQDNWHKELLPPSKNNLIGIKGPPKIKIPRLPKKYAINRKLFKYSILLRNNFVKNYIYQWKKISIKII